MILPPGSAPPVPGTGRLAGSSVATSVRTLEQDASLRPVEIVLLGYSVLVALVAGVRAPELPGWEWLIIAHGLLFVLFGLFLLQRPGQGGVLRELTPLLLLFGLYAELDVLSSTSPVIYDDIVQGWEAAIFGGQPSRDWWRAWPSPLWSTILHGAYLGYYLILAGPPIWFAVRRDFPALRRFMLMVMTTFVVCYIVFIFAPVAGPYYMFPRPEGPFVDNPMARLVYGALSGGSSYGAAFPSSHVAATAAALAASWRASPMVGRILVIPTVLLFISVVYCQMHYAVDAIAGLALGLAIAGVILKTETDSRR